MIIEKHRRWLKDPPTGKRANLRGASLAGACLAGADLRGANMRGADLRGAILAGADLRWASLLGADLRDARLCDANLIGAHLRPKNLAWAVLTGAHRIKSDVPSRLPPSTSFPFHHSLRNSNEYHSTTLASLYPDATTRRSGSRRRH